MLYVHRIHNLIHMINNNIIYNQNSIKLYLHIIHNIFQSFSINVIYIKKSINLISINLTLYQPTLVDSSFLMYNLQRYLINRHGNVVTVLQLFIFYILKIKIE